MLHHPLGFKQHPNWEMLVRPELEDAGTGSQSFSLWNKGQNDRMTLVGVLRGLCSSNLRAKG